MVPAFAVFGVAMAVHVAMNLLHLREDLQWCAARIARVTVANTIEALQAGDDKAALKAMSGLRDEWLVSVAEVLSPEGRRLATYRRGQDDVRLESAAAQNSDVTLHVQPAADPQHPQLYLQAGQFHLVAAVERNHRALGFVHILVPLEAMYPDL